MSGNRALRRAREEAGLTQAGLAVRAGVSRQLVGGAESGRHAPSVDTALRIARALDSTVEELFARSGAPETAAAAGLADGTPVAVGRVGERLVAHPLAGLIAGDAAWASPDGVVQDGSVRLLPGASAAGLLVVGCDPLLGLCEALLGGGGARRLTAVAGTSGTAVAALGEGRAHAGVVHGPEGGLPPAPATVERIHVARWRVGIAVPERHDAGSLEPVLDGAVPLVQRDDSASSQQALVRAAGDRLPPAVARATGHVDAARRAALAGCAAVTFEPAARQHGLAFVALETHVVELWIDARWMDHPGARALVALLGSDALRRRAGLIGGYDLEGAGAAPVAA